MNKALRSTLRSLRRHFLKAADRFPGLFFELLSFDPAIMSEKSGKVGNRMGLPNWIAFLEAHKNRPSDSWESPEFAEMSACGRFFGRAEGLPHFKQLAESLALVLNEISPLGFADTPIEYTRCIYYLHAIASAYPTPLLRLNHRMWDLDEDGPLDEEMWHQWATADDGSLLYPLHPSCTRFVHGVFTSAEEAIRMLLAPSSALFLERSDDLPEYQLRLERAWGAQFVRRSNGDAPTTGGAASPVEVRPTGSPDQPPTVQESPYAFKRVGRIWHLRFAVAGSDPEHGDFPYCRAFLDYAKLLKNPGVLFESYDLDRGGQAAVPTSKSDVVDAELRPMTADLASSTPEIAQYLQLRAELEDKIEIANSTGNTGTAAALTQDLEQLQKHLNRISYQGKPKRTNKTPHQFAHEAIAQRFRRTQEKLTTCGMPKLALYLNRTVRPEDGHAWRYSTVEPLPWDL